jgi:hypothetical protein
MSLTVIGFFFHRFLSPVTFIFIKPTKKLIEKFIFFYARLDFIPLLIKIRNAVIDFLLLVVEESRTKSRKLYSLIANIHKYLPGKKKRKAVKKKIMVKLRSLKIQYLSVFSGLFSYLSKLCSSILFKINKFLNILFNVISLNKLPIKGGLTYFFLLITGIISSITIRLNLLVKLNLDISNEVLITIKILSCLYACYLVFNFTIISKHAYNLIFYFKKTINTLKVHVKGKLTFKDLRKICIYYYFYYFYITLVTS